MSDLHRLEHPKLDARVYSSRDLCTLYSEDYMTSLEAAAIVSVTRRKVRGQTMVNVRPESSHLQTALADTEDTFESPTE